METLFTGVKIGLLFYLFLAPFVFIYLQQSLFRTSFDDELGTKLIVRLYLITAIALIAVFMLTISWESCWQNKWGHQCVWIDGTYE